MFNSDTDKAWEKLGKEEPYFGVIAHDQLRMSNLTEDEKEAFFDSGRLHIEGIMEKVRHHIDPEFKVTRAIDFGCGVGRLVVPLAGLAEEVTGIDVSDSMLKEAEKNCQSRSITNAVLTKSDDALSTLKTGYNFIHSFIVFQHIPVKRGEQIFKSLIELLEEKGVGVLHFTYAKDDSVSKWAPFIKNYLPFARNFINILKGRSFFAPQMQMNNYRLKNLFHIMQIFNITDFHGEYTNHSGELGIVLMFQKPCQN